MNIKRKQAAVKKYQPVFDAGEDAVAALKADEKKYTDDEITEIVAFFNESPEEKEAEEKVAYEEWEVKIVNKKAEKLKVKRPRVNITEEEANILNNGVTEGGNNYALMYFLPE